MTTTYVGDFLRTLQISCLVALSAIAGAQQATTLSGAIRSAQTNRPAFESARLRLEQASASRRSLGAYPTTRLFVGYTSDVNVGGSDDDLVLSHPIDIFGRTSASRNIGNALVAQAEAGYRQVAVEVQSEVIDAYLEAVESAELAKSAASVLAVYERLYEATKLRVDGGVVPGFHLTQVSLDLEQARLRSEQRQSESSANTQRLAAVMGLETVVEPELGFPDLAIGDVDEANLVRNRPDLLLLAADVKSAEAEARLARTSGLPELEVQGRRTPWQERDDQYGVRFQLSIPIFDSGKSKFESKAATIRAESARKALADATKLAVGEIKATRIEVDNARTQVGKYGALVEKAKELVERLRPGLTEQATTLIEVLDATRMLRDLEQSFVEARERLAKAQAKYLKASGQLLEGNK